MVLPSCDRGGGKLLILHDGCEPGFSNYLHHNQTTTQLLLLHLPQLQNTGQLQDLSHLGLVGGGDAHVEEVEEVGDRHNGEVWQEDIAVVESCSGELRGRAVNIYTGPWS